MAVGCVCIAKAFLGLGLEKSRYHGCVCLCDGMDRMHGSISINLRLLFGVPPLLKVCPFHATNCKHYQKILIQSRTEPNISLSTRSSSYYLRNPKPLTHSTNSAIASSHSFFVPSGSNRGRNTMFRLLSLLRSAAASSSSSSLPPSRLHRVFTGSDDERKGSSRLANLTEGAPALSFCARTSARCASSRRAKAAMLAVK